MLIKTLQNWLVASYNHKRTWMLPFSTLHTVRYLEMLPSPNHISSLCPWWTDSKALESFQWLCLLQHPILKTKQDLSTNKVDQYRVYIKQFKLKTRPRTVLAKLTLANRYSLIDLRSLEGDSFEKLSGARGFFRLRRISSVDRSNKRE